jgi:hypothetical protein
LPAVVCWPSPTHFAGTPTQHPPPLQVLPALHASPTFPVGAVHVPVTHELGAEHAVPVVQHG